jgi:hypothetical protein
LPKSPPFDLLLSDFIGTFQFSLLTTHDCTAPINSKFFQGAPK